MLGYTIEEMLGTSFSDFVFEDDLALMERKHKERSRGVSSGYELRLKRKNGDVIWTFINASPLLKDGNYIGSLGMVIDITDYKQKEFQREENERRYRSLFEDSPIPTWEEDFSKIKEYIDGLKTKGIGDIKTYFEENDDAVTECAQLLVVNDVNTAVVRLNNAPSKEYMMENYAKLINARSKEYAIKQFEAIANGNNTCEFDAELITFSGNTIHVHLKWTVVKGYEENYGKVYLTTTDVTERILAENQRLRVSNLQKELLLKEIHHRVKNNLQIITSLLRLQANSIDDEEIRALFDVSLNRINSMALVHDLLYRSKDLSRIPFRDYLGKLLDLVTNSMKCPYCEIETSLEADDFELNISTSILLGLLINELVSNSIKHAFTKPTDAKVYVKIVKGAQDEFILTSGDNGRGFELPEDLESIDSLGLQLIYNLVEQLNGSIEKLNGIPGTHFKVVFNEMAPDSQLNT